MPHNILIVEDEAFIADLFKANLEQEGYTVDIAHNGAEAIEKLSIEPPEMLLLDLLMPETDGFAVLKFIRENEKSGKKIPVVILTNLNQPFDRKKCKELGATDFIVKSNIDVQDLSALVRKYLP